MQEDRSIFFELMGNIHFQQILYRVSIMLLVVIAVGTLYFHGSIIGFEPYCNLQDVYNCSCDLNP